MAQITATEFTRPFRLPAATPVFGIWAACALLLGILWALGIRPNGDVDDLLKAAELRHFVETAEIFDRTLPGVLQPEPFVSHWPWLVDLPYALVAWCLAPLIGLAAGLSAAMFVVPLILLAPTLFFIWKIGRALGFDEPAAVFLLSIFVGLRTLAEFQPGRVDYHNLQMLLLVASVYLTLNDSRVNTALNALVTALALAIGLELAALFALVLAIRAFDFVKRSPDSDRRLAIFGATLGASAMILFAATTAPSDYMLALYDRYSSPHAFALAVAGVTFVAVSLLRERGGPVLRGALLGLGAAVSCGLLIILFPDCMKGPYAALSPYLRDNWLANISQEMTMFERPDFILSRMMTYTALVFVGALSLGVAAMVTRERKLVILALFALVATVHALFYFRYFRFLPLLAGPGLALAVGAVAPLRWRWAFSNKASARIRQRWALWAPGLALSGGLVAFHLAMGMAEPARSAADVGSSCSLDEVDSYDWSAGSRILSPPLIGIHLLGQRGASVTAIPFHTADKGIERAHRFFDPQTTDPRIFADQSHATHIAVCAWRGNPLPTLDRLYPFASGLMQGRAPAWLTECTTGPTDLLRIYTLGGACPGIIPD
jgi:hypothetical protein